MPDATEMQKIVAHANKHDLEHLAARIKTLDATLKSVAQSNELADLIIIIGNGGHIPLPPHGR
jgi:hypothetical protein